MRIAITCLVVGLALLTACRDQHEPAASATAPASSASAPAIAATSGAALATSETSNPGERGPLPDVPPGIVTDTAPVDTQVVGVKLSNNGNGKVLTGLMTDQFKPSDGVFMSISTQGTAAKYTLSSKWLTPAGETLSEYSQEITTAGPTDTIFSLSKPDGWPKGQYKVELSVNGKLAKTVSFTVR
jgi:hypothetical protein